MTIKVKDGQSLYDLALQCYGDITGYWWLLEDNGLTIESEIRPGQVLIIRDEFIQDRALFFRETQKEINNSDQLTTEAVPLGVQVADVKNEINGGDGYIRISVTGGSAPYGYFWSNGATSKNLLNVSAGTYTVIVEDAQGAQVTLTVSISVTVEENYLTAKHNGEYILTKSGDRIKLRIID